jgi:hypothetical protein
MSPLDNKHERPQLAQARPLDQKINRRLLIPFLFPLPREKQPCLHNRIGI